ncbi:pyrroline-5-carboxylate reductase [Woeseia oceani]|uniref:Pyrroline-5-carboxylate reductase n=1 Tax=Woeseia oceani TaxID=1548547 RepID=A0A193LCT7_9GAMM|nr:pyrroline-5-carboxylate reductase [Woeseia oceani]ANO50350.1 pyrroline-5-carboxylate reductase [Woeseia oceani]
MINDKIGFIGGGNMARAIAGGLLRGGMHATDLLIAEPSVDQGDRLRKEFYGTLISDDNAKVAAEVDILLFAVKPQILRDVCLPLADVVQERKPLIMSIAAGPRIDDIESWLGGDLCVVRVMPNQPALIDQGVSALISNSKATAHQRSQAEKIMSAVGQVVWLQQEALIDAVTAVSGTGPAYFYLLIDIMIESAISFGIDPATARTLAIETARGAASLALAEEEPMKVLIDRVRSPGGTTTAAFEHLEATGVRDIFAAAIKAARDRATELGNAVTTDKRSES